MIKITTENSTRVGFAIFLTCVVGISGTSEEEIRVGGGKVNNIAVAFDLVKGGLKDDG